MYLHFPDHTYKIRGSYGKQLVRELRSVLNMAETLNYKVEIKHHGDDETGYVKYSIRGNTKHFEIIFMHENRKVYELQTAVGNDKGYKFYDTKIGLGRSKQLKTPIDFVYDGF